MDEAIEAGLLVEALRAMPALIEEAEGEATGPIDSKHTRWKILALELWGQMHEDDSGQEHVGESLRLPPTFAVAALKVVRDEIEARLAELGVAIT